MGSTNQALTLEVGKTYLARSGAKYFICYQRQEKCSYPYVGYMSGAAEVAETWDKEGKCRRFAESENDLLAEFVEPKRVKGWLSIYPEHSQVYFHATKDQALHMGRNGNGRFVPVALIEIDVLEGAGLEGAGQ